MSVPLPSESPLTPTSAKPIPSSRSRPRPINTEDSSTLATGDGSPRRTGASGAWSRSPGNALTGGSPLGSASASFRRQHTSKSSGFNGGGSLGGTDDNWRERTGTTPSKTAVRTVGGFGKGDANGISTSPVKDKDGNGEKGEKVSFPALSHVPCRFFKAGACTAGANCPFSHEGGAKKEVCQWFLKGNCKFGHKCALAHVRPGEPMSMDRKNKKAAQLETREREGRGGAAAPSPGDLRSPLKGVTVGAPSPSVNHTSEHASPVPIKSALSTSIQSPPAHRLPSSPLRDPFGPPPPGAGVSAASPGFARSPAPPSAFASSPSRPSPLSGGVRPAVPGSLSLKANLHSPLRPPAASASAFSSSFSHSSIKERRPGTSPVPPLSASFADGMRRNIWARSETPMDQPEVLSPRRAEQRARKSDDVFDDDRDEDEDGDDLAFAVPDALAELLTPRERARRMSRRDSQDSFSASPSRGAFIQKALWSAPLGPANGERLAQSAGPTMGPGFLQGLWSAEGGDARKVPVPPQRSPPQAQNNDFTFGPSAISPPQPRQSLLSQQRSPPLPQEPYSPSTAQKAAAAPRVGGGVDRSDLDANASPFMIRALNDPSSPSARALQEHAPGQSLPGGLANALSRIHLQANSNHRTGSGLANANGPESDGAPTPEMGRSPRVGGAAKKDEMVEEGLFDLEG